MLNNLVCLIYINFSYYLFYMYVKCELCRLGINCDKSDLFFLNFV